MIFYFGVFILCLAVRNSASGLVKEISGNCDDEDYYWRDYKGVIPVDAVSGGINSSGEITYIAQVLHRDMLIPGEIVQSEKRAYYEWGFQEFVATENVKILCTGHPQQFQWVLTTRTDFKTLTKDFIPGGFEPNNRIYIGRKHVDKVIYLGKVQVELPSLDAMFHYTNEGKGVFNDTFEILTYLD